MKVLVVGGGGREHSICWKLAKSPRIKDLYCAPGNAGIAEVAQCVEIGAEDIEGICEFAVAKAIDLAVIGPEVPLAMGIVDKLEAAGIRTFGPNAKCSQLEASKSFTKAFLERHHIPTAGYKEFTDKNQLLDAIGIFGFPMVLKADGLAAGKGVVIAETEEEAGRSIEEMMGQKVFGSAADKVVVEEFLTGTEASMLCFVDENTIVPMESAQDYKRINDGDKGPNTGGMGTYSPSLVFTPELEERIHKEILLPTLKGFQEDGLDFKGVLFIGLMISEKGPKVIEFNNRFGDPETQSVLPRMKTDLLDVFMAVTNSRLADVKIEWKEDKAVCVVLASDGYPGSYAKGKPIAGLDKTAPDVLVFHAGTKISNDDVLTWGGRVLGVTALGKTHEEARRKAYENVAKVSFEGMQYRKDIGTV
ncbi:MAG: phosphoribosylamine--glycine ligase [Clostridiales bacterium]|nr:phosphoribosylamine--glycine ligase [Clostridiales bacterium]